MLIALVLANFATTPDAYIVQKCSEAHEALNASTVTVKVKTVGIASEESTTYKLAYRRPGEADLTIVRAKPLRIVVTPEKVSEYDESTKQFAEKSRIQGDLSDVLKHSASVIDELVSSLLEPQGVKLWLAGLKQKGTWKFNGGNGSFSVETGTSDGHIVLSVDPATKLLKHVSIKSDKYGTDWDFSYSAAPKVIAFSAPNGSYQTNEIRPQIASPTFASKEAKMAVEKIFAKYDSPKRLGYTVQVGAEKTSVWIDHARIHQGDAVADWVYSNKVLNLTDLQGQRIVSGAASVPQLVNCVAKSGTRVEQLLRLLMKGINPFRFYLGQNANVTLTGKIKVKNQECLLLEAKSLSGNMSLIVRASDGFVMSMLSTSSDKSTSEVLPNRVFTELVTDFPAPAVQTTSWQKLSVDAFLPSQP